MKLLEECKCGHKPPLFVIVVYRKNKRKLRYCDNCLYKTKDKEALRFAIDVLMEKRR